MFVAAFSLNLNLQGVQGAAPGGLQANVASTSAIAVNGTANNIFATTTCASRVVTTRGNQIYFTVGNEAGQDPVVGGLGHLQLASTTEVYDSGTYGCGMWKAISQVATTITVTEFTSFR